MRTKLFKNLRTLHIASDRQVYWCEILKSSQGLRSFKAGPNPGPSVEIKGISHYIKRLPKRIQNVNLSILNVRKIKNEDIWKISKALGPLKDLRSFKRWYLLFNNGGYIEKELEIYNRYMSRLKKIDLVMVDQNYSEQAGLQQVMRKDKVFPAITGLKMYLVGKGFESYNALEMYLEPEGMELEEMLKFNVTFSASPQSKFLNKTLKNSGSKSEENYEGDNEIYDRRTEDSDFLPLCKYDVSSIMTQSPGTLDLSVEKRIMTEEIAPFYRFHLFPNLRKLSFLFEDHLYPLGSFVEEGFAQLRHLKQFDIDIMGRPKGTVHIFKGLLCVPSLLDSFVLKIDFLRPEDWLHLGEFLQRQAELRSLSIIIRQRQENRRGYLVQNQYLEDTIKCLKGNKKLTQLNLQCPFWSLETLSKGLRSLGAENQFESLRLEGLDDTITSLERAPKRVEGLCEFIKEQKGSLRYLTLVLPFVLETEIMACLGEAIAQLKNLKRLVLHVNHNFLMGSQVFYDYLENVLQYDVIDNERRTMRVPKTWNLSLAKVVKELESLEELSVHFDLFDRRERTVPRWFISLLRILPELKKLREFEFYTESLEAMRAGSKEIGECIMEMYNVKKVREFIWDMMNKDRAYVENIARAVVLVNQRQAMRCDLMF